MYKELRCMKDNIERKNYLNKFSKDGLVNYYFSNLSTATNKAFYLRKTKKELVDMILNHYINCVRDEELNNIKV